MSASRCAGDEMTTAEHEDQRDKLILHVLCEELLPWTVEEVSRELDSPNDVIDGVSRLVGAGLGIASASSCSPPEPHGGPAKSRSARSESAICQCAVSAHPSTPRPSLAASCKNGAASYDSAARAYRA